jgi:hypothetical protein
MPDFLGVEHDRQLRKVTATYTPSTRTYVTLFRVRTYKHYVGPLAILRHFSIGQTIGKIVNPESGLPFETEDWSIHVNYNYGNQACSEVFYEQVKDVDFNAVITNVSIVSRETLSGEQLKVDYQNQIESPYINQWLVEVSYTSESNGTWNENPKILEEYQNVKESINFGSYQGVFRRTNINSGDPNSEGDWEEVPVANPLFDRVEEAGDEERKHMVICNSAGTAFDPPLRRDKSKKRYTITWSAAFALDFSKALGKTNCNKVCLKTYDVNNTEYDEGGDAHTRFSHAFYSPSVDDHYPVFAKEFEPRQLLLESVSCECLQYQGRDFYRYKAVLAYDEFEHDVFLLDEGYEIQSTVGTIPGGDYAAGSRNTTDYRPKMLAATSVDKVHSNKPILLNGIGRPLMQVNPDEDDRWGNARTGDEGNLGKAVWLRWRIYPSVLFSVGEEPTSVDELKGIECPLMTTLTEQNFVSDGETGDPFRGECYGSCGDEEPDPENPGEEPGDGGGIGGGG